MQNKKVLTAAEITDWMMSYSPVLPTQQEIEDSLESLVNKGILETLWNEDGEVLYRLTNIGDMVAKAIVEEEM